MLRGPSAIAEFLVLHVVEKVTISDHSFAIVQNDRRSDTVMMPSCSCLLCAVLCDCRVHHYHQVMDHSGMDHGHGHDGHMDHDSMNCTLMHHSMDHSTGHHAGMHHAMMVGVVLL